MNGKQIRNILLIGILLSAVLSTPAILRYTKSDGYDPQILSDWDEAYYLPMAYEAARSVSLASVVKLDGVRPHVYTELGTTLPHALVDLFAGKAAEALSLRPALLGLLLDIVLFPCAFLIFTAAFFALRPRLVTAAAAALVCLLFPWVAALSAFDSLAPALSAGIATKAHDFFPSRPLWRGLYTQLSYPLFGIFLLLLFRQCTAAWRSRTGTFLLGISAGLLLYVYFFAWGTALALLSVVPVLWALHTESSVRRSFLHTVGAIGVSFVVAFFGLTALFNGAALFTPGGAYAGIAPLPYSGVWFLSPIEIVVAVLISAACLKWRRTAPNHFLVCGTLIVACVVCEHGLMNMQPILNRWLTPYHFPLFYLHPLMSGVFALATVSLLNTNLQRILAVVLAAVAIIAVWTRDGSALIDSSSSPDAVTLLLTKLDALPGRQIVATIPYDNAFDPSSRRLEYFLLPYWIKVFTHHRSFSQFLNYAAVREPLVEQELRLGLLYSGTVRLVGWCPDERAAVSLDDLMRGAESFLEHQRHIDCAIAKSTIASIGSDELERRYPIDLMVSLDLKEVIPVASRVADASLLDAGILCALPVL